MAKIVLDGKGLEDLQIKLEKGEQFTPEEEKEIMSVPNEERVEIEVPGENEPPADDEPPEAPAAKEKPAAGVKTDEVKKETPKPAVSAAPAAPAPVVPAAPLDENTLSQGVKDELEKPEQDVDLRKFNKNEQALYWEAKRQRRRAQAAEVERDGARFKLAQERAAKVEPAAPSTDDGPFAGKEPDEFITVADFNKALAKQRELDVKKSQQQTAVHQARSQEERYLKACGRECQLLYDDADEVLASAQELDFQNNPDYLNEVGKAYQNGENPAVKMYHILKSDPRFDKVINKTRVRLGKKPAASTAPAPSAEEQRIEENKNRPKTTGSGGGGTDAPLSDDEMELKDIAKMEEREFSRLPKAKRDKFLKRFGA